MDVSTTCDMSDAKRKLDNVTLLAPSRILTSAFIDTSKGVTLTSEEAMDLIRSREETRRKKRQRENQKRQARESSVLDVSERNCDERDRHVRQAMLRSITCGDLPVMPRSLRARRTFAKKRFTIQHQLEWSDSDDPSTLPCRPRSGWNRQLTSL